MTDMESELLREYLVIVDEMNLTRAAEQLHTTQSTLSKHIAVLEREFGTTLLLRGRRGLGITEAGALLYRRAASIVDLLDSAHREMARLSESMIVRVTGILYNNDVISLLSRVGRTLRDTSNTSMVFLTAPKVSGTHAVLVGEADIAIGHKGFSEELDPDLVCVDLYQERFVALVEEANPLSSHDALSLDDLRDQNLARLGGVAAEFGWANIQRLCRNHGFEPKGVPLLVENPVDCLTYPLDDTVLLLQRGILPVETFASGPRRCIPLVDDDALFTICAYCRADRREQLSEFIDELRRESAFLGVEGTTQSAVRGKFRRRCELLAREVDLNESEMVAMRGFAKGRSIDRIAEDLGLSRIMVGDLLASVYKKAGVRDRQSLLDRIEAKELPW
ncbi:LysR family transcriptional regulator [Adlercreutzia sp. ZJ242]|uniref:LysR family transcriptional regulator n=1 Tax=Adlercreutzia sp. ZJ242 TaxID=2709409 RepID=UPI00351BB70E